MNQPKFWIGCFQQPKESFPKWAAEGVNIAIQPAQSGTDTPQQRRKAAVANGLWYIDVPDGATTQDMINDALQMVADPACYAICLSDEPSESEPWYTDPAAAVYVANYLAKWKPVFDAIKGKKTIWSNFGSDRITSGRPWYSGQMILPYVLGCNVTELSLDSYPINANTEVDWTAWNAQKTNAYNGGNDPLLIPGENEQQFAYRVLQSFCPGLPIWSYLETEKISATSTTGRGPTAAEIQAEADAMVKMGAKGLIYFTHNLGGGLPWDPAGAAGATAWDGRNPEELAACKAFAAKMNGSVVVTPPPVIPPTVDLTTINNRLTALETAVAKINTQVVTGVNITLVKGTV